MDTAEGKQTMPFSRGWGEKQLRAAAEARGLLGGQLVSAHGLKRSKSSSQARAICSVPYLDRSKWTFTAFD